MAFLISVQKKLSWLILKESDQLLSQKLLAMWPLKFNAIDYCIDIYETELCCLNILQEALTLHFLKYLIIKFLT